MGGIRLEIDGREIAAERGERLLWVARDAGIEIPSLCSRRGDEPPFAACRLCWVEIEGRPRPVTSCTVPAEDGLVVQTRSPAVDRLVASAFELLLTHHRLECRRCPANHACALQQIARSRRLKLRPSRVSRLERRETVDDSHPAVRLDQSKCVLCGKCVWACHELGRGVLDFAFRGLETVVSTFEGRALAETPCDGCLACARVCPVGALSARRDPQPSRP